MPDLAFVLTGSIPGVQLELTGDRSSGEQPLVCPPELERVMSHEDG